MSRMTSQAYSIARSTGLCAATGRELRAGDRCVTALVEAAEGEALERLDYTAEAWDGGARPARLFGFWRGVVPDANAKPKAFIDDESLMSLFEQLAEAEDSKRLAFRFVLTLILIRKRLLRHEGSKRDGARSVMLVRARGADGWNPADPMIEVVDPELDEAAIAEVTELLGQALAGTGE